MHPQRTAVACTAAFGVICTLLPWVSAPRMGSLNGFELDNRAVVPLLCCAALAAGMFVGKRPEPLTPGGRGLCRLGGGITALIAIMTIAQFSGRVDSLFGRPVSVSAGVYLLLLVGIAIIVLPNAVTAERRPTG